ncbi:hypothetical protein RZN25_18400 [Bacillaceae bacterium S4-13-56]
MVWNLRIPLTLFLFGLISGMYQYYNNLFLFKNSLLNSIQFILTIILIFVIFEKQGLNSKKVHFSFGLLIVAFGFFVDLVLFR